MSAGQSRSCCRGIYNIAERGYLAANHEEGGWVCGCLLSSAGERGSAGRDGRGGEFPAAAVRRQERAGRESAEDVPRLPGGVSQHSLLPLSLGGGCMLCVCVRDSVCVCR